jgi:hypothetical protein
MRHLPIAEAFLDVVTSKSDAHCEAIERRRHQAGLDEVPFWGAPIFFDARERLRYFGILEQVTAAIERVGDLFYSGGTLPGNRTMRFHIPLPDRVLELCRIDCRPTPRLCVARYDVLVDPKAGSFDVLEINPSDPSGMGSHDVLLDALLESPVTHDFLSRYNLSYQHLMPMHRGALNGATLAPVSSSAPSLAFAVAKESTVLVDHRVMFEAARRAGHAVAIGDPREFTCEGGRLYLNGMPIQVVWRDIIDEFTTDPYWEGVRPFVQAYQSGGFALRNRFCTAFADCKGVFDILSDERNASIFTAEQVAVLRAHIPWTRLLMDGRTIFMGEEVDLVPMVRKAREEFVIKPNIGNSGYNVLIGVDCPQDAWEHRIEQALLSPGSDVIQRFCPPPKVILPTSRGTLEEVFFVSSFWQYGRASDKMISGSYVRASHNKVINIHQGGGFSTVFWAMTA